MNTRLDRLIARRDELTTLLADPDVTRNIDQYASYSREYTELEPLARAAEQLKSLQQQINDNQALVADESCDDDLREMAGEELDELVAREEALQDELKRLLIPTDPNDQRNVIIEVRAGTGGDEAALFAADLFRMYGRYAEQHKFKVEILSSHEIGIGGYKEVIAQIKGAGAFSRFKFESGVHRVQRVPATESGGRIHTSACTVAVLPEADDVEVNISPEDLRIDVFRASGPGGQSVNTTDSAVRITHVPSGIVVTCQDEKSQHKNKAKAMKVLQARLFDAARSEADQERADARRGMVGSGDRSERIRTYNFPQGRVTDHRINLTLYKLEAVLAGDLDELIDALLAHHQAEQLTAEAV
ncbi:MAG: peptide chain release factor 1 [Mariprofundaceae bacterium]